ncbi:MAG: hypothetical protein CSA05_01310 [Bacteroidia bacterium]|nr:MAG: hypothetical protein CSA05_01310 [Bacteroidia bacterium]
MAEKINWKFILNTIKSEKCILLLGPELPVATNKSSITDAMCDFLSVDDNENISSYYEKDGFFLFPNGMAKTFVYYEIKDFYSQKFEEKIYEKIAQIPFHLIISLNPDLLLSEAMKKLNIPHEFEFYKKKQKPKEVNSPSMNAPLVYNMFGSIEEEESLILTHDDLFDFLLTTLGSHSLPAKLQKALREADNFIFLGFNFERWYMQLLIRLLNPPEEKYTFIRYALNTQIDSYVKSFYIEQFRIKFIESESTDFIDTLFRMCKNNNILRKATDMPVSRRAKIEQFIENDDLPNALAGLKDYFMDTDDEDMIMMQTSRYNRLKRKLNKGVIDANHVEVEINKIKDVLIQLAKQLEDKS